LPKLKDAARFRFIVFLRETKTLKIVFVLDTFMSVELVKDYIAEFQRRSFGRIVERELKVKPVKGKAITIIGHRRAGKTYFLFQLISRLNRDKCAYLDFEDIALRGLFPVDCFKVIREIFPEVTGSRAEYVFLDEVQNLREWESLVRTLLDRGYNVFVSGSSSKLLSKEIATQLRGRSLTYLLLPFSFREFLRAKNVKLEMDLLSEKGRVKHLLKEYMEWGGFPEVVLSMEKEKILKEYIELAFFKGFIERHRIQSTQIARYIFEFTLQNFARELTVRSMARKMKSLGLKFNINTLYRYMENLEDTLFIFFLKRYSPRILRRESWPRKVYVCDTGLTRVTRYSEDIGKQIENIVFLELKRRENEKPLQQILCWKDGQGREVDFMVKEGPKITQLIQVTYATGPDEIDKREIKSLLKASKTLNCKNLTTITWDYEDIAQIRNREVKFTPLWKWLLKR